MLKRFLNKFIKNQKGLTLVELLAVVVILGIVSSIATVSIGNIIQNSREDAFHADAILILSAAELAVAQNGLPEIDAAVSPESMEGFVASTGSYFNDTNWRVVNTTEGLAIISNTGTATAAPITVGGVTFTLSGATLQNIIESRDAREDVGGITSTR